MKAIATSIVVPVAAAVVLLGAAAGGQTSGEKESFTAVAIANNNLGSGTGTVLMNVTRDDPFTVIIRASKHHE